MQGAWGNKKPRGMSAPVAGKSGQDQTAIVLRSAGAPMHLMIFKAVLFS